MALKQHSDIRVRYEQQVENSRDYVVPFVQKTLKLGKGVNVLEIGTAEGGVLKPFMDLGCYCVGVDIISKRIRTANEYHEQEVKEGKMEFICQNVYHELFMQRFKGFFDIIILKDTIEHVPEQNKFIPHIHNFLKPGGQMFFGFPPWNMPFGGHQQIIEKKFMSMLPYYHILPMPLYKGLLKLAGVAPSTIEELEQIKECGINIEDFERVIGESNLKILNKQHFLINPIYRYKFGLKPRKQTPLISSIPYLRNFLTTCVYYTISKTAI